MKLTIQKDAGMPLYLQIKDQLKKQIEKGLLAPGERLPTERELAEELGISRNTVSMAFEELKQEGDLIVGQGKGTFVAENPTQRPLQAELAASRKERALRLIDLAIDECLDLGFSLDQFMALTTVRVREKEDNLNKIRVLFIDCNSEQLSNFVRQFRELVQLEIIPVLLSHFTTAGNSNEKLLQQTDLIITTTTHVEEVARKLAELGNESEVVPVAAQPRTENLIRLSRLAGNHHKIGLVCLSPEFPAIVERALAKLGVFDLQIDYTTESREKLGEFIAAHEVILAFQDRYKEVKALAGEKEVIPYLHELDLGSVTLVRRAIERILREKRKGERR